MTQQFLLSSSEGQNGNDEYYKIHIYMYFILRETTVIFNDSRCYLHIKIKEISTE